ncbi:exosortase/archaeosortase family protein [Cryobacterium tepidiphilum]|uniref:Uncharacterized protein n=1 Tax=Cryobacterium tepidiphilum TaxID=2486026 RepID=A0A3M8L3J9_9MICO|nr:exosortase/archaeosortase family protein [Cryobacterium tepidiphilum]RNE59224.1 hypothetical protein EEJ31_10680 [Cryobacterium tepidiphilum]
MSDTTPNTERPTDAASEPAAVRYDPAVADDASTAREDGSSAYATDTDAAVGEHADGGAVTTDQVLADPPVTADPPAVDGEVSDDDVPTSTLADGNVAHTNPVYVERDDDARDQDDARYRRNASDDAPEQHASTGRYVSAADVSAAQPTIVAAPAATDQDAPAPTSQYPAYQPGPTPQSPIYVQAPVAPKKKGNRGIGILIALLATLVYALIYAGVVFLIAAASSASTSAVVANFTDYLVRPVYYVPVIFFFLAFSLLIAIVNRGGWWAYVLFGFLVAVVVYFAYIGGALLTVQAWNLTPQEAANFVRAHWLDPGAIAAAVIAREVPIWAGAWIARRGRAVTARNADARRDYDRAIAEGPQLRQPA